MQIRYIDGQDDDGYRPGACNIGPAEIRARRITAVVTFAVAGLLAVALVALDAPTPARWLVALPMVGGFVGMLQAQMRFCANYGFRGLRNFGALGQAESVADANARAADRRKALLIVGTSTILGVLATIPIVLLPA